MITSIITLKMINVLMTLIHFFVLKFANQPVGDILTYHFAFTNIQPNNLICLEIPYKYIFCDIWTRELKIGSTNLTWSFDSNFESMLGGNVIKRYIRGYRHNCTLCYFLFDNLGIDFQKVLSFDILILLVLGWFHVILSYY